MKLVERVWMALAVVAAALTLGFSPAVAQQFDAPFVQSQKQHEKEWAEQDSKIDGKLAKLKKKFGKTPNIIYILADDVGWGELGWQGGGKHRGTPTPEHESNPAQQGTHPGHDPPPSEGSMAGAFVRT